MRSKEAMADIFISYSSKDRAQAEQLTELLASAGLSVWIDKQGIDVATSWSGEIVDAIEGCKAFVVLLSPHSVESVNVVKEVSLAAEQKKKILPLDLEPVELPRDLKYHLAGLQRAPMTNIDAIIRTLGKLGLQATQSPSIDIIKATDSRTSLMILPFDDLSPTRDNEWFADGIVSELIGRLSHLKVLRLIDQQETKNFKQFKGHLTDFARTMHVRYFVQGSVRKFGDQIKIMTQLLDIHSGDYLWQDVYKGSMQDIFDIQETVAEKVVAGLTLHLTPDERRKLAEEDTLNAEAYELYLKGIEYSRYDTKEGCQFAIQVLAEALRLDPHFALAHRYMAASLSSMFVYERSMQFLVDAESHAHEAIRLKPDMVEPYHTLSIVYRHQGKLSEAEAIINEFIRKAPQNYIAHFSLGLFYFKTQQYQKAIAAYEQGVRLNPENFVQLFNLVASCVSAQEFEKARYWSLVGLPLHARHLKLHPDDIHNQVCYAVLFQYSGQLEESRRVLNSLPAIHDGGVLYNIACLYAATGDMQQALTTFRKSIEVGYRDISDLKIFLENDKEGIASLAGTSEYESVRQLVMQIEAEAATTHG